MVGGAVQLFDVLGEHIGMIGGSFGQLLLSLGGLGLGFVKKCQDRVATAEIRRIIC